MRIRLMLAASVIPFASLHAQGEAANASDYAPLDSIIVQVDSALADYQRAVASSSSLPPLKSADFDFKTTVVRTAGFSISLWIITIGSTQTFTAVNDVEFTYEVPKPPSPSGKLLAHPTPPTVREQLVNTILGAAKAVASAQTVDNVPFKQLTVSLQYGVKREVNGEGKPTFSIVTLDAKAAKSKDSIQTLKLTFAK